MGTASRQLGLRVGGNGSGDDPWLCSVAEEDWEGVGEGEGERGDANGGSLGRDVSELLGKYQNIQVRTYIALGEAAESEGEACARYGPML